MGKNLKEFKPLTIADILKQKKVACRKTLYKIYVAKHQKYLCPID